MSNLFPAIGIIIFFISHEIIAAEYTHHPNLEVWYNLHKNALDWPNAYIHCKSENASLVMPKNQNEVDVLLELLKKVKKDFLWIGLHDFFLDGEYLFIDESYIQYGFSKWGKGKPKRYHNELAGGLHKSGTLDLYKYTNKAPFVCERRNRKIEENQIYNPDEAYRYYDSVKKSYKMHMDPRNWGSARTVCYAEGGTLAIIRSEEEEQILMRFLNEPKHISNHRFAFVGFHDMFKEGYYITTKGEDIKRIGYLNWCEEELNFTDEFNCGVINRLRPGVSDQYCFESFVFICERSHA